MAELRNPTAPVSPVSIATEPISSANGRGRLLKAEQLAERWQVPTAQVYRLTRDGRLPAVRIGRYYRYRLGDVEAWECSGGVAADA